MTHCRQAYGGLLGEAGRWQEAETELQQALELSHCAGHRASALARLARLRIHQNRIGEAAELLAGWEDRLEVSAVLAQLHDAREELDLAASTISLGPARAGDRSGDDGAAVGASGRYRIPAW